MGNKNKIDNLIHEVELVEYKREDDEPIVFRLDPGTETIWATQAQIAALFKTDQSGVSRHLKNIFDEGELEENSNMQKLHIAGSAKPVIGYSVDAVISVGYRVNSKAATSFRRWATATVKAYIEQGFVINERALRASPEKLDALASQIRTLRAEEKHIFAKVKDCFKISSSDYDPSAREVRTFYALLQDKFHYAVTTMTSAKLVMDRADHMEDNMGVVSFSGKRPTKAEASIGKNFLTKEELYRLHILSEQFLLYAEATALAGKKMTMASLQAQLDRLLTLNDYKVFGGYEDYLIPEMKRHIDREYGHYIARMKVEAAGLTYDALDREEGLYDDLLRA